MYEKPWESHRMLGIKPGYQQLLSCAMGVNIIRGKSTNMSLDNLKSTEAKWRNVVTDSSVLAPRRHDLGT